MSAQPDGQPVLILGTRAFAEEAADLIDETPGYHVAGFVENMDSARCANSLVGHRVYWIDEIGPLARTHVAVCALGTTHRSRFTDQAAALGVRFATLVHPTARVSTKSAVGEGAILSVGCIVAAHSTIGRHVLLNRGVLIGHHTTIGDHCTLSPGANVAGGCHIGEATYVGMGAIVLDNLKVGRHCVVAAGSVVTKDVPDNVLVMGVPARVIKENIEGKQPMSDAKSSDKLIINCAPTGMVPTKADNPHVPITPDEIAEDCARCREAGASILHVHARDDDGRATWCPERYKDVILKVRRSCPDAIVCVSTSGRTFKEFDQRAAVLGLDGDAKPDMASLTLGSLNFPKQASVNEPAMIRALAERMRDRGIVPELEVFDFGMLDYGKYLIDHGVLRPPFYFNLLLGSLGTLSATPFNLATLVTQLPAGATWAAAGIGRFQFAMNSLAIAAGGHVRVGLEDNLHLDAAKQHPATNLALVERVARVAAACERPIATPTETRRIIGLP